jgi:hypothetical protein
VTREYVRTVQVAAVALKGHVGSKSPPRGGTFFFRRFRSSCFLRSRSFAGQARGTNYNPGYARNKRIQASVYFSWPLAAKCWSS